MLNYFKNLKENTYTVVSCPLCGSRKSKIYKLYYENRYTEEFSKILKIDSSYLMKNIAQIKCNKCHLVYKRKWFKSLVLKKIYNHIAPAHPNGWDIYSKKFSKKFFFDQIKDYKKNIKEKNIIKRTIVSIVQSIKDENKNIKIFLNKFINAINQDNEKLVEFNKNKVANLITNPKDFSRFTGFNNIELFKFIKKNTQNIKSYAEIGCPLWGLCKTAQENGMATYFVKPNYDFFWGKNCKKNSISCLNKIKNQINILELNKFKKKYDYIGIYNYIDHLNNLSEFLDVIFKKFKYVGIIQEDKQNGYPIQHNYGMNYNCMKFIAKKYKKNILTHEKLFKKSKYNFYLFV